MVHDEIMLDNLKKFNIVLASNSPRRKELMSGLGADTIVWMNGEVLGKPKDREDAIRMLRKLSGASHQVITGVCLTTKGWQNSFTVTTDVTFAVLSEEEIVYYVDKYSPMDKAGAYGVQEWIGFIGVESISGSYYNVMGVAVV